MRLINTETLELEEFIGSRPPSYAILSHTWKTEEVSLQDWYKRNDLFSNVSAREGYAKILGFCKIAREDDYRYVWVDTCCIDKTSSAELTESINSMFRWYKQAEVCYVYLMDFDSSASSFHDGAKCCRWFTRGWTLQELIAPADVRFYDVDWQFRGTRKAHCEELVNITGIDSEVLRGDSPSGYSVADRMSWAASRQTTRMEDNAYCLLGLFDVNLPLIYGEGVGAFRRLQEAIIKSNNDLSILAWGMSPKTTGTEEAAFVVHIRQSEGPLMGHFQELFATSPSDYEHSKHVQRLLSHDSNPEFSMTNKGLRIDADLVYGEYKGSRGYFLELATLCVFTYARIWLKLGKGSTDVYFPEGLVVDAGVLEIAGHTGLRSFYVSCTGPHDENRWTLLLNLTSGLHIPEFDHIQLKKTIPETQWNATMRGFYIPTKSNPLVLAAWFQAQIPQQNRNLEFIVIFDTVASKELDNMLCRVLDCKEYPQQSDWILSDRGPGRELLWPDLIFNMPEVIQLSDYLHVRVGGTMLYLQVSSQGYREEILDIRMAVKAINIEKMTSGERVIPEM